MAGNKIGYWMKTAGKLLVILLCTLMIYSTISMFLEDMGLSSDGTRTESDIKSSLDSYYYSGDYGQMLYSMRWYSRETETGFEKYWNMGRFYEALTMKEYWQEQASVHPGMGYEAYAEKYQARMKQEYENYCGEENLRIMQKLLKEQGD